MTPGLRRWKWIRTRGLVAVALACSSPVVIAPASASPKTMHAPRPTKKGIAPLQPIVTARTLRFTASVEHGVPVATGWRLQQGELFEVIVKKPDGLRVTAVRDHGSYKRDDGRTETISFTPYTNVVADGKQLLELSDPRLAWFKTSAIGPGSEGMAALQDRGFGERTAPAQWIACDLLFSRKPMAGFKLRETVLRGEQVLDIYERTVTVDGVTAWDELHIDKRTGLPSRLSQYVLNQKNGRVEGIRTTFSQWKLNPPVGLNEFVTTPPTGYVKH